MNRKNRDVIAILLLVFGVLFLFDRLNWLPFGLFFNGWWTLLLIIPAILSMSRQGINAGNAVLLGLGVFFFIDEQGWNLSGYLLPVVLIALGIGMLFKRKE